jgi:hypothetical protein
MRLIDSTQTLPARSSTSPETGSPSSPQIGRQVVKATGALALLLFAATAAPAATLTLQWDPPADSIVAGYLVVFGKTSGSYTSSRDAGPVTIYAVTGLADGTKYCFAVQAYDRAGTLSSRSAEVCGTTPAAVPPPTDSEPLPSDPVPPPTDTSTTQSPYGGTRASIPGLIEAENFDEGAAGVAYNDTSSGNAGSVYRNTNVDLQTVEGGGYSVGWTQSGEWLTYSVNVATAGAYVASFRVGSAAKAGMTVSFTGNGVQKTISVPNTGGTQTWATVSIPVTLTAGNQVMRVGFTSAGVGFQSVSLNRVGTTRTVAAGGSLQSAIDAAQPGDTILLQAGATFTGNFVLRKKAGASDAYITIRSAAADSGLPATGVRMSPSYVTKLPKLRSPSSKPALRTEAGAHHYRLQFLEFLANPNGAGDIIALGDGTALQDSLADVPYEIVLDRLYIHGNSTYGQRRAIALNSASTQVLDSYISEIKAVTVDAQAIAGWNGPGPFLIANNYLEASGQNVAFGTSAPAIAGLAPSDISLWRNRISKKLTWRTQSWRSNSLLELRNAEDVMADGNVLENTWESATSTTAGSGFAVRMYSANVAGSPAWSRVKDVEFTNNTVRNVSSGLYIARDAATTDRMARIAVRNNLFDKVSGATYGGLGVFLVLLGTPDVTIDHNTVFNDGYFGVIGTAWPSARLQFTNNILVDHGGAIVGGDAMPGVASITKFFPSSEFLGGLFIGADPKLYPAGNLYPATITAVKFVSYSLKDYRLAADSIYNNAATDGTDPGCNITALKAAQQ